MHKRVDYDSLAETYNMRFEADKDRPQTALALDELARQLKAHTILEVGCGTGRWIAQLQTAPRKCYGLDPSRGMLSQAQKRDAPLTLIRGYGEELPFPNATFDLVYCVNAIHHMSRQADFVREAYRIVRPGGALAISGADPHNQEHSLYVYEYFDGVRESDLARFPSRETVIDWMRSAGFQNMTQQTVGMVNDQWVARAVLQDPFLAKKATSQMALLSDADYERGLKKIAAALDRAAEMEEEIIFETRLHNKLLIGHVG